MKTKPLKIEWERITNRSELIKAKTELLKAGFNTKGKIYRANIKLQADKFADAFQEIVHKALNVDGEWDIKHIKNKYSYDDIGGTHNLCREARVLAFGYFAPIKKVSVSYIDLKKQKEFHITNEEGREHLKNEHGL